jgi:UTP--glucose-1-phosphate uridylyltransferase
MVRKAVIPAAGLGTRFLPATKSQPKEMLPVIDTPTIQYVVQEAIDSGIEDILIISGKGKRAIEDHFDRHTELESLLALKDSKNLYNEVRRIGDMANIHYIRQKETNGLGDAIYYAKQHVGNEPFAVLLGDTMIDSAIPVTQQLIDVYDQYQYSVIASEPVPKERVHRYGIIEGVKLGDRIWNVTNLVEKPDLQNAPSNLAIASRYILTPEIFTIIEQTQAGKNNEIQLTDALRMLLKRENIVSYVIEGTRYDIGNKLDYLKTIVSFGLKRKEFSAEFLAFLKDIVGEHSSKK